MRMLVEGKNKRKKKGGAEEGERPDDDVRGTLTGDYVVGQVARSLFQGRRPSGDSAARLASLFSSSEPQLQPVYVPVPRETTTKRKRDEEEESTSQIQRPLLQEPSKSVKAKKKLSDAHKRKNTLASRDLEEEIHQKQEQKRNNFQSGINVADKKVLDVDHIVLNQRKKIEINQEEEKLKNERTVFVGNLPVTCNKKIPAEGTLSKKLAAIKNGAQIADGFRIRVDLASETSSRDKRSVFVGNLPYKVEESAVEEHFLDCGSIVAVRIVRDRVTGVGRGFGYVLFENTDAVHLALKLNNSELMGRKLRVMRSVNKEKLKPNSNPSLKNVGKPKEGLNSASKNVGLCKNLFIGEKAVLIKKKKKKGQKKSGHTKKQKKQK
ncbi:RNA-binding protein 34 isoform X4 [Canis lupus dingo]|uniref:RNA-binding protein 34 isoform X4 n=1 Tax=Canis lupus dingo TaxID=286419 RepID=UPI000BAA2157|nr:RNA-binding protein 34 isoform X4 [Canis lupus dingo]|eukprot:XP_022273115.1 RNA-binding protein 34 isoform X4 [Canis lupus familiaris]